jgi:hypothetical protein
MKRTVLVLLAVALACAAAFAEDSAPVVAAKFNLNLFTGAYYNAGDNTIVAGDSDNLGDGLSRIDFKGDFSYENIGAKFTFRRQSIANDAIKVRRAFAYYNILGGKIQVQAGRVGSGDFSTSYNGAVALDNGAIGALFTAKPIDGLELGYLIPFDSTSADFFTQFLASTVAVSYSIPDILTVQLWVSQFDDIVVVGDISVSAVKNLTLSAEAEYNDATDYESGTTHFTEQVAYAFGKITPSIVASEVLVHDAANGNFTGTSFFAQPGVAYAYSDKLTFGAEYKYGNIYADLSGTALQAADFFSIADAYVKYDWGKASIKVKPGFDTRDGQGFFVRAVFDATL